MENINLILKVLGAIIISLGVVFMYDARKLTKKYLNKENINVMTIKVKIVGLVVFLLGCGLFLF